MKDPNRREVQKPKRIENDDPKSIKRKFGPFTFSVYLGIATFIVFIVSAPYWATDEAGARITLIQNGLNPITIGGYDSFGCGFDVFATQFTARNTQGFTVHGNVCKTPYLSDPTVEIKNEE